MAIDWTILSTPKADMKDLRAKAQLIGVRRDEHQHSYGGSFTRGRIDTTIELVLEGSHVRATFEGDGQAITDHVLRHYELPNAQRLMLSPPTAYDYKWAAEQASKGHNVVMRAGGEYSLVDPTQYLRLGALTDMKFYDPAEVL